MKIIEKLLAGAAFLLTVIIVGAIVTQYRSGNLEQAVIKAASSAEKTISTAVSEISSQISSQASMGPQLQTKQPQKPSDSQKAPPSSTVSKPSVSKAGDQTPAIPVVSKITAAPSAGGAQSRVSTPVAAETAGSVWGETGMEGLTVYEYGKTLLSDKERAAYSSIASAVRNVNGNVTVNTSLSSSEVEKVFEYYLYDHSEVFYINGVGLSYYSSILGNTYRFTFDYKYGGNKSLITSMRSQIRQKALEYLSSANGLSTDLQKEKALHDKLIEQCSYDIDAAKDPDAYPDSFSAYGALVKDKAVCQGYAQAMKLLLSSAGIRSVYVTGQANGGGHAWDIVQTGGEWRYLDATFDDPVFTNSSGKYVNYNTVSYTYFNFTNKGDHVLGTFKSDDPFSSESENYAIMPQVQ